MNPPSWLPELIELNGDWTQKVRELYQVYEKDFIIPPKPTFLNLPIRIDDRKLDGFI